MVTPKHLQREEKVIVMATQRLPRQLPPTPSFDVMDMLRQHVPLTLLVDIAFPVGIGAGPAAARA